MSDWTVRYLASGLPQRLDGDPFGDCEEATTAYSMENEAIRTGQRVVQLSQLYAYATGFQTYPGDQGFCPREDLCPMSLIYPRHGEDPAAFMRAAIQSVGSNPPPLAVADAPNQKLLSIAYLYWSNREEMIAKCQAHIDSGRSLRCYKPPNHVVCAMGYFYNGLTGFDNKATSPGTFLMDWDEVFYANEWGMGYVEAVAFIGGVVPVTVPPASQPIGDIPVTSAQLAAIQSAWNSQSLTAMGIALTAIGVTTIPGSSQSSPDGTIVPPAASVTDPSGAVWTLGAQAQYGKQVLRSGVSAVSGQATSIVLKAGQIKVQNSLGDWWLWNGSNWASTTAP